MTETTTTSIKIHWSFIVFLAVISFLFYYGCTQQNALETTDNKHFKRKIDSLENLTQHYENQAEKERLYRNELHHKKDSLQVLLDIHYIYMPDLQQLKRTRDKQKP